MPNSLQTLFSKPEDLLDLTPEDLGGIILTEAIPNALQSGGRFLIDHLVGQIDR
jgi:hypothetical protein